MVNPWFCKIEGEEKGPFSPATLRELVDSGKVTPETHIRRGDSSRWVQAAQVQGLFTPAGATAKSASASSSQLNLKRARSLDTPPKPPVPPPVAGPPPPVQATPSAAAAPPPPRDSQAVPTGTPVGVPVGSPAVPMGQAVAPVGTPTAAHADDEHYDPYEARRQKKKQQQLIMVIGLVAVLVLAVGGGLGFALLGGGSSPEVADDSDGETPTENDTELPAEGNADAEQTADKPTREQLAAAAAEEEQAYAVEQLLSAVDDKDWVEISSRRTISLRGMYKLKVTEAWLSGDPLGSNVLAPQLILDPSSVATTENVDKEKQPADITTEEEDSEDLAALLANSSGSPNSEESAADETDTAGSAAKPRASSRYLIVALEVTNSGESPLTYESWNPVSGEEIAASLIANEKTEIKALTRAEAAGPGRSGKQQIAPGETVADHLVFEVPEQPVNSLKLLLPKEAIGREGMYGFLITPEVLAVRYESQLAAAQQSEPATAAVAEEPMPANTAAPPTAVAAEEPKQEEPQPLSEAEKLRLEREAFLESINGPKEEKE